MHKTEIVALVEICYQKGIQYAVISPGSRNAAISIAFKEHNNIETVVISDERSASFFAIGIAQQTGKTVALVCTSGTAVLNFAPAIAEAYYQNIPLLILTADRPIEWIDQQDGQTIRQNNVYANYSKASFTFPQNIKTDNDRWYCDRITSTAINISQQDKAPVHINIPAAEPLFNSDKEEKPKIKIIHTVCTHTVLNKETLMQLAEEWNTSPKILILCGQNNHNADLNILLNKLADFNNVIILTEKTSNLIGQHYISTIDRLISSIKKEETKKFQPHLLLTLGNAIVSKKIKTFLRNNKANEHWHIDTLNLNLDTYQSLTKNIPVSPTQFFTQLLPKLKNTESTYKQIWNIRNQHTREIHNNYLSTTTYSDLKTFEKIIEKIPPNSNLHLGNSTPIRYIQLFDIEKKLNYFCNRGTSGIEGSISTAAGAVYATQKLTTMISGDISFLYDSNALWNHYLSPLLKIIIINNKGGGIFRFIPGPSNTKHLETLFEAEHQLNFKYVCKNFNINYYHCNHINELDNSLNKLYENNLKPTVLEIETPQKLNADILRNYFKNIEEKGKTSSSN